MAKAEILIVEDDGVVARDIQNRLKNLGFAAPTMVPSGEEAIEKVKEHKPNLVLMDIILKGEMNGTEAADQIRSQFDIPVVYLTAYADEKVLERAKVTEPFGYIIKPFEDRELNAAVEIALYKHKMDKKLKESEEWLSATLNSIGDAVIATDKEGHVTLMNPVAESLTGWQQEEAKGKPLQDVFNIINEETREKAENPVAKVLREGTVVGLANHTVLITKDGTEIPIDDSGSPIKDEKGEITGVVLVFRDVRGRREAEEALRESEEKFRSLSRNAPDIVYSLELDGSFAYLNPAFEKILGYKRKEALGKYFADFGLEEDVKKHVMLFKLIRVEKKTIKDETITLIHKDGSPLLFNANGAPNFDKEGNVIGVVGLLKDITEHRKLEDQLHRAQKMEALGLMAGGVAHDLNNILSGIVSYPELLLMDLPEDSPLRKPIKTMQESGMKAADVVADLMTIVRGVATGKETLKLNTVVEEYLGSAEHQKLETMHSFITFKTKLDSDLLNISCSPTHIKKTLMNLVVNASDAIEGRGAVTISSTNRYLDEPLKGYENVRQGEYAVLSVSDEGTGISPEDLERIFEPFYSKKVMGQSGTGLGLAVVWNTVQDHKGYINVKSSDKGTVFELYFPVTREEVAAEKEEVPLEDYLGHGEKILVVDDEERQREITCGMLAKLGYNAEAVSSGEEAIEYVKDHSVDLIVLDMVMPKGINGRKTYEEIIKIRPGQKAIIASGYAKTKEVDIAQSLGAGKYIKKPYTMEKVGIAVKEELEK